MTFIAPLTSLRFLAAAAVAAYHLQGAFGYQISNINFAPAITFFFVLSGFVLTHVYHEFPDTRSVVCFYVSRIARLWPLHLMTALYFLLAIFVPSWEIVLSNLLLVQSWSMELATAMSMNGVSWSISVEVFFYLVFPLVVVTRRYWPVWLVGSALVVVIGLTMAVTSGEVQEHMSGTSWLSFLHVGPPARFLEFAAGVLTALLFRRHREIKLSLHAWTVLEVLALVGVLASVQIEPFLTLSWSYLPPAVCVWLIQSGSFPTMCLAIFCFAYSGGVISRVLSLKPFIFLGDISFALYMVHQLVLVTWLYRGWAPHEWDPAALSLIWAQIMAVSALSFLVVEKPAKAAILSIYRKVGAMKWGRADQTGSATSP